MNTIKLLCYNNSSIGIKVIIEAFKKYLPKTITCDIVRDIQQLSKNDIVIPYGPKETYDTLKRGHSVSLSLMVDYHTLSLKNRTLFLLRNGYVFNLNAIKSLLGFFLYYYRECFIARRCNNFMFVSQYDIEIFKKRFPSKRCYCVPNGVKVPDQINKKKEHSGITFGILSGWTEGTFLEAKWFIDRYWPKMVLHHPDIKLNICGKFASDEMIAYFNNQPNVNFIGEVVDLADFFDEIDIYVATKPIGCGILNKVLDAMAYKTLVVGIHQSFTGFTYMKNSYVICDRIEDYYRLIDSYLTDRSQYDKYINNAYQNILKYNNWDENYNDFINKLISDKVIN